MQGWGRLSAAQVAVALLAIVLAMFVAIFAYFVADGYRQTQRGFEERSAAATQVVSTNAYWIAEVANQTLRRVDAAIGERFTANAEQLGPATEALPSLSEIYIVDRTGNIVFTTIPDAGPVSVVDREYFTALRDGAFFYTSPLLVSRISGKRVFVFSKAVRRGGEFVGAVVVSFPETVLEDLWHTLELGDGSTISLVRSDGQLMGRYPPSEGPLDLSTLPLFTELLPASPTGTYSSSRSPVDGIARVVSYRRVEGTQIIALASVGTNAGWSALQADVIAVMLIVSPIVVGLILGCWWIITLNRRDLRQREDLTASVELNTLLFREIHHRIKNNLQSVQALVRMQDIPESSKRDLQSRLAAMAAMHEHIYQNDRYADIDAHDFVPAVVDEVVAAYGVALELRYEVDHIAIDRDHATPLALLLSELVTNACKYAFRPDQVGIVTITLQQAPNGRSALVLRDNGVGMPADPVRPRSMGMRLISGIVGQMDGTYHFSNDHGTVFTADLALSTGSRQ